MTQRACRAPCGRWPRAKVATAGRRNNPNDVPPRQNRSGRLDRFRSRFQIANPLDCLALPAPADRARASGDTDLVHRGLLPGCGSGRAGQFFLGSIAPPFQLIRHCGSAPARPATAAPTMLDAFASIAIRSAQNGLTGIAASPPAGGTW